MTVQHHTSKVCSLHDDTAVRNAADAAVESATITIEAFGLARCRPARFDDGARSGARKDEVDRTGGRFGPHGVPREESAGRQRLGKLDLPREQSETLEPSLDDCARDTYLLLVFYIYTQKDVVCERSCSCSMGFLEVEQKRQENKDAMPLILCTRLTRPRGHTAGSNGRRFSLKKPV